MGFFKRAGTSTGRKRGKPPRKKYSSATDAKKSKFENKKKRKKDALGEEIPSSSEEEEIGDDEVGQKRQKSEETIAEGEQQYEDDRTLADREALRLLEATKEISTGLLDELEEQEEDEKEQAVNARAHRPFADQIQTTTHISCKPHRLTPVCICFSRNSDFLVSCAKDRSLIKYDLKKLCRVGILRAEPKNPKNKPKKSGTKQSTNKFCLNFHEGQILCCAISPDDKYLITGGSDCMIKVWSFDTLEFLHDFDGHRGAITSIRFRQQCEALEMFTSSRDRSIIVWNLDEMGLVNTLYGHQDAVEQLDILQWPRLISCGGMDKSCRLFKILEDSHLVFNGFAECVSIDCIALINEEHFISGSVDGSLYIWSTTRKKPICVCRNAHGFQQQDDLPTATTMEIDQQKAVKEPRWICSVAALPYTDLVASGSSDGYLRLWRVSQDWKTLDQVQQIQMPGFINDIRFSSDGHFIGCVVGQEHKRGRWWKLKGSGNTEQKVHNRLVVIPLRTTRTESNANDDSRGNDDEGGTSEIMEISSQQYGGSLGT